MSNQAEEKLFKCFEELGIETRTVRHAPVFSVEDSQALCSNIEGGHCKSLFLKDKKGRLLLVVLLEDRRLDIKALQKSDKLSVGRLSFGSAELMQEVLGVTPGSVTPFSLVNLPDRYREDGFTLILDKAMMDHELLNYHPLHNEATTTIRRADLLKFVRHFGIEPIIMDFDAAVL
ncbi:prolyl-tRNA synthetase associated domain-containing protein [Emcibacter nanhaiensis]|uniref:Prolyl-tRNA synthetase associated domain-containing protein n=1 Tax=Emcibacter nanhaiensis TaxID=1505037 RepID=A0A501PFC8_9PROT|nr:prolyl-tRNA synthetase associated domain-containing protein [Emcibacter nanhaiensis]TPD59159.1 prolyl-tRNA synthetase associated domain-containing protein [Emcibacter nanhaiensis]